MYLIVVLASHGSYLLFLKPFSMAAGYFIENVTSDLVKWFADAAHSKDAVLMGEFSYPYRSELVGKGRVIGQSYALYRNRVSEYYNFWPLICQKVKLINASNKKDIAQEVLDAAMIYPYVNQKDPGDALVSADRLPSSSGGYLFLSQDIEFFPGSLDQAPPSQSVANEVFSGIIALLWAGRQVLGKDFKIVPVVGSGVLQNRKYGAGSDQSWGSFVDIESLLSGVLKPLGLVSIPKPPSGVSPNLMSTLFRNGIIDGFIDQGYSKTYLGHLQPMAPFHPGLNLPYAIQVDFLKTLGSSPPSDPIEMDFYDRYARLPLDSAVHFSGSTGFADIESFDPVKYFNPTPQNVLSHAAALPQTDSIASHVIDLTSLASDQVTALRIQLRREASFRSVSGFYRVVNVEGAVQDPLTGELVLPGESSYSGVALSSSNLIANALGLHLNRNGATTLDTELYGGVMMAPFAKILEPGHENIFFSFAAANGDRFSHFKALSPNSFGMEDVYGGGDNDFNDLEISFRFLEVS